MPEPTSNSAENKEPQVEGKAAPTTGHFSEEAAIDNNNDAATTSQDFDKRSHSNRRGSIRSHSSGSNGQIDLNKRDSNDGIDMDGPDDDDERGGKERRKIEIKFIQNRARRHITFSKRKHGIMKKAWELSVLTGTQVLLLVVSETGLVYTFTTPKLQPIVTQDEGKRLIQTCLNAPDDYEEFDGEDDDSDYSNDMDSGSEVEEAPGMIYLPTEMASRPQAAGPGPVPLMYPDQVETGSVASPGYAIPEQMSPSMERNAGMQNPNVMQAAQNLQNSQARMAYNQQVMQQSRGGNQQYKNGGYSNYQGYGAPMTTSQYQSQVNNAGPRGSNAVYASSAGNPEGVYQTTQAGLSDIHDELQAGDVDNMHMPTMVVSNAAPNPRVATQNAPGHDRAN